MASFVILVLCGRMSHAFFSNSLLEEVVLKTVMPIDSHQCLLQLPSYKCPFHTATTHHRYRSRHSKDLQKGKGRQKKQ